MPLQSCATCGYALAIIDGSCRHCNPTAPDFATRPPSNFKLVLTLAPVALLLGFFIYRLFIH